MHFVLDCEVSNLSHLCTKTSVYNIKALDLADFQRWNQKDLGFTFDCEEPNSLHLRKKERVYSCQASWHLTSLILERRFFGVPIFSKSIVCTAVRTRGTLPR